MKKVMLLSFGLVFFMFAVVCTFPCQAAEMNACAKKKNGQLRIVADPSQCKKSEIPVVLSGMAAPENPVPDLKGTWRMDCEGYKASMFGVPGVYETKNGSMVITEQTGSTFTGTMNTNPEENPALTGVVILNMVAINKSDEMIFTGAYVPETDTMLLSIIAHNHDAEFSTYKCVCTR